MIAWPSRLVFFFVMVCCASYSIAQNPEGPTSTTPRSRTYGNTEKLMRRWIDSEKSSDFAQLLETTKNRTNDLVSACHSTDDEIAASALRILQFQGKNECSACWDQISGKQGTAPIVCSPHLSELEFQRVEHWMATKHNGTHYQCNDDVEPLDSLNDSVIYALILEGSSRSRSILDDMRAMEKECASGDTILGEVLERAPEMIETAKSLGHNLDVAPDKLAATIRATAFFLPMGFRKASRVKLITRDADGKRILLEVSYTCGRLCGQGYHVILRQDGNDWHYALITMAWIS